MKQLFESRAEQYFGQYPKRDELHFTSEGYAFFTQEEAEAHAQTLDNQEVYSFTRAELIHSAPTPVEETAEEEAAPKAAPKKSGTKK